MRKDFTHATPIASIVSIMSFVLALWLVLLERGYDCILLSVSYWMLFGLLPVVCNLDFMLEGQSLSTSCCIPLHFLWI